MSSALDLARKNLSLFLRVFGAEIGLNVWVRVEGSNWAAQPHSAAFATTHWSAVLIAGQQDSPGAAAALEELGRSYWYPLYAYLRRTNFKAEEAEDLVQGFFLYLLDRQVLQSVEREGGRFRSFLLGTLKHFVSDQKDKASAQKRGAGRPLLSWERLQAEARFLREPADEESADRLFDRRWATTLLEQAMERLRQECVVSGKTELFAHLKSFISGEKGSASYAEAAAQAHLSPSALKSAIFRLRRRYHELVREQVRQTLTDSSQLKEELGYLLSLFSAG